MRLDRVVTGAVLAGVLAWTSQASAGWIIDQVTKAEGERGRQQVLLQANRMKTTMLGDDGKPVMAFILDLNTETLIQVDYQQRSYFTATVREFARTIQGLHGATETLSGAMEELQEQMKDLPPDQRRMLEEAMRGTRRPIVSPPTECREPRIETRKTSEQAVIAGYPAVRHDVLVDGKLQSEVWIAKGITAWRELDPQKLERFMAEMAKAVPCAPDQLRQRFPGADPAFTMAAEGYPVRIVERSGGGGTIEVVKAASQAISAAEFQPPRGFPRKELRELMGQ